MDSGEIYELLTRNYKGIVRESWMSCNWPEKDGAYVLYNM